MSKITTRPKAKHWCLTINNYTPVDEAIFNNPPLFKYAIYGREKGENGTPHLQAFVTMWKQTMLSAMKKIFPRAHLEIKRGSVREAVAYCKKDMDFQEYGVMPLEQNEAGNEKNKEKWDTAKQLAIEGRIDEIDSKIFVQHYGTLKKIRSDYEEIPKDLEWTDKPPNQWIYGPTGTGKSRKAKAENPGHYLKMCNKWWENYAGEETVLMEDIGIAHAYLGDHLKIWADRYGFRAEIKHDSRVLRPQKIIVTSNYHPKELWTDNSVLEPILRRFQVIYLGKEKNGFEEIMRVEEEEKEKEKEKEICKFCYYTPCDCVKII